MKLVLGIDLGTTFFKIGLFNKQGQCVGLGRLFVEKDTGDGSRCELSVQRFWTLLKDGLQIACQQAGADPKDIQAVSYASQANSFLLLDVDKNPLTPIIIWADNRVETIDHVVRQLFEGQDFMHVTGMGIPCSHQVCIAKCMWIKNNQSHLWHKTHCILTISDYLTFALTDCMVGDAGTASLLGLLDVRKLEWWNDALYQLDISSSHLVSPVRPGTVVGGVSDKGARFLGLKPGTWFVAGSLDHHMAALPSLAGKDVDASVSVGTVLACLRNIHHYMTLKNNCVGPAVQPGCFYQMVFDANGASSLEWYQKNYAKHLTIDECINLAKVIKPGSDGLLARPHAAGFNGLDGFVNVSEHHQIAHFCRAILESTAASLKMLLNDLFDHKPNRLALTGGGTKSDTWMQLFADITEIEIVTLESKEPACQGAAILASLAAGWFPDLKTVTGKWTKVKKCFNPNKKQISLYQEWYSNYLKEIA
jgi:sugar (pentulose or hexulose) kinase